MQLITLLTSSFSIYFAQCDKKSIENSRDNSGDNGIISSVIWRSIIGDICQLSSFPRPTTDPNKYVECVFQAENAGNRSDLGIWASKNCPTGYQFLASARECKVTGFIKARQQLCEGSNAEKHKFCPQLRNGPKFMVKRVEQQKEQCLCVVDEENCDCPKVVIIELVTYDKIMNERNISKARQARHAPCQNQQRCIISDDNCDICSNSESLCTCGPSGPTNFSAVNKLPNKQIPEGCQLLNNGQQYCTQMQGKTGKQQYSAIIAPQPCPTAAGQSVEGSRYQKICSWMIESLVADPESPSHFLQCQPAPNSLYCGRWQRMPCEPGLIFNALLQVCVWNPSMQPEKIPIISPSVTATYPSIAQLSSHASSGYLISPIPVIPGYDANTRCTCHVGVHIGFCGPDGQCPGQSICKSNELAGQGSVSNFQFLDEVNFSKSYVFVKGVLPFLTLKYH
uniref:Chitin-binding type-2 domain-containing protein n=2 Tax=Wuchereria bancrofti TaxID=6293 RepID=A0AAF5RT80_WUCBA